MSRHRPASGPIDGVLAMAAITPARPCAHNVSLTMTDDTEPTGGTAFAMPINLIS
jgi:hypothetical protein